jgi:hypothetical protein
VPHPGQVRNRFREDGPALCSTLSRVLSTEPGPRQALYNEQMNGPAFCGSFFFSGCTLRLFQIHLSLSRR